MTQLDTFPPRRRRPPRLWLAAGGVAVALPALLGCAAATAAGPVTTPAHATSAPAAGSEVQRRLDAHLDFLADDLLAGRLTGAPGHEIAARYVASQLQAMGLQPVTGDSHLLPVPLRSAELDRDSATFELVAGGERRALGWGEHFVMSADLGRTESEVEGEMVYVGYGVVAPRHDWDDYAGLDVRGKVVLMARGTPAGVPPDERAYLSTRKTAEAIARGAVGIVTFRPASEAGAPWERAVANAGRHPEVTWLDPQGVPHDAFPEIRGSARIGEAGLAALFGAAGKDLAAVQADLAAGKPKGFPLGVTVRLASRSTHRTVSSPNVAAVLPGSDPARRGEVVVLSAHLDHVGESAPVDGDSINNGFYDNAFGTALLLEAARELAAAPRAPRRTIVFLAVTGEEQGLLGSEHFATHPPAGLGRVVANVNLDMPLFLYPVADLVAFGAEHSTLDGMVEQAAASAGFVLSPDPFPHEVIFVRSDQYSFVKQGVPSVFLVTGQSSRDPEVDGAAVMGQFLSVHYHQPTDEASLPVDWPSALRFLQANVTLLRAVADAPEAPRWKRGDFFGETFGRPAGGR
jgi:hypothetical protein